MSIDRKIVYKIDCGVINLPQYNFVGSKSTLSFIYDNNNSVQIFSIEENTGVYTTRKISICGAIILQLPLPTGIGFNDSVSMYLEYIPGEYPVNAFKRYSCIGGVVKNLNSYFYYSGLISQAPYVQVSYDRDDSNMKIPDIVISEVDNVGD